MDPSIEEKLFVKPMPKPNLELTSPKYMYDEISLNTSIGITKKYSTSFSIGIRCLDKSIRNAIYQIYGFVRVADEIVDSFHGYDKEALLDEFEIETYKSIERKISTNPVLNSFQAVVNRYNIDHKLIESFLYSMRMDLESKIHNKESYDTYIYGSAEVVGLMCLYVFVNGDMKEYIHLRPTAMKLGSAFQKINFLRDIKEDSLHLGRVYFPGLKLTKFDDETKDKLIEEIEIEFEAALEGIKKLPNSAKYGVYLAYLYYKCLAAKIGKMTSKNLLKRRASVSNFKKLTLAIRVIFMRKLKIQIAS
jgi:phytoene/squalene synthetase